MAYEDIAIPVPNFPASAGMFGNKVRDAILDLDRRVSVIESVSANYAVKTVNSTKASLTTPSADSDLFLQLEANAKYFVEVFIVTSGLAAADLRTNWAIPSGAGGTRRVLGPGSSAAVQADSNGIIMRNGAHAFSTQIDYSETRDVVNNAIHIQEFANVNTGATAGQLTFQWSQAISNATGTVVHADSFIRATQIG